MTKSGSLDYDIIYAMMPLRQHLSFQYVTAISPDGNAFVLICYLYISQSLIVLVDYIHILD